MIIRRIKYFSTNMVDKIVSKLESEGIDEFEVSEIIPKDCIGVSTDLSRLQIYIPVDMEFTQYEIDSFLRSMVSYMRTGIVFDRNIYVMKLSAPITEAQYLKLIKYIISEEEYCVIVNN